MRGRRGLLLSRAGLEGAFTRAAVDPIERPSFVEVDFSCRAFARVPHPPQTSLQRPPRSPAIGLACLEAGCTLAVAFTREGPNPWLTWPKTSVNAVTPGRSTTGSSPTNLSRGETASSLTASARSFAWRRMRQRARPETTSVARPLRERPDILAVNRLLDATDPVGRPTGCGFIRRFDETAPSVHQDDFVADV